MSDFDVPSCTPDELAVECGGRADHVGEPLEPGSWADHLNVWIEPETDPELRALFDAHPPRPRITNHRDVLATLLRGVRLEAERLNRSPFEWPAFGPWLATLHGHGVPLVLAVVRDEGVDLAMAGSDVCIVDGQRAMRLPSPAAAAYLTELVVTRCDVAPSSRTVRRAMALLGAQGRRIAA